MTREVPDAKATSVLASDAPAPAADLCRRVLLLQLANAAMLPLMAGVVTTRSSQWAPVLIAACIIVPQAIVALTSPSVGRIGASTGAGGRCCCSAFAALAIRGLLFATVQRSLSAGRGPGVRRHHRGRVQRHGAADRRRRCVRQRSLQSGAGHRRHRDRHRRIASTVLAGYVSDKLGSSVAFLGLAGVAALGLAMIWLVMPETRRATI